MSKQTSKKDVLAISMAILLVMASSGFVAVDYIVFNPQSYRVFVGAFNAVIIVSIVLHLVWKSR